MKYFIDALKNYFNFKGRTSRKDYWMYVLSYFVIMFTMTFVEILLIDSSILYAICSIGLLIPTLSIQVRRLHDINKSGWFILISSIPFGGLFLLYLLCKKGTEGPNRFDTSKAA